MDIGSLMDRVGEILADAAAELEPAAYIEFLQELENAVFNERMSAEEALKNEA